jgi:hypothetical protein
VTQDGVKVLHRRIFNRYYALGNNCFRPPHYCLDATLRVSLILVEKREAIGCLTNR